MKTFPISVLAGLASVFAGPVSRVLAAKSGAPAMPESIPWLAMVCSVVAIAGVCVVAFRKPNRSKGD
jgi:hypothetical protein